MQAESGETVTSCAGHVGFVFSNEDLTEIKGVLLANKVLLGLRLSPPVKPLCQARTLDYRSQEDLLLPGFEPCHSRGTFGILVVCRR